MSWVLYCQKQFCPRRMKIVIIPGGKLSTQLSVEKLPSTKAYIGHPLADCPLTKKVHCYLHERHFLRASVCLLTWFTEQIQMRRQIISMSFFHEHSFFRATYRKVIKESVRKTCFKAPPDAELQWCSVSQSDPKCFWITYFPEMNQLQFRFFIGLQDCSKHRGPFNLCSFWQVLSKTPPQSALEVSALERWGTTRLAPREEAMSGYPWCWMIVRWLKKNQPTNNICYILCKELPCYNPTNINCASGWEKHLAVVTFHIFGGVGHFPTL